MASELCTVKNGRYHRDLSSLGSRVLENVYNDEVARKYATVAHEIAVRDYFRERHSVSAKSTKCKAANPVVI